jgi:molecular chaperone GrpE
MTEPQDIEPRDNTSLGDGPGLVPPSETPGSLPEPEPPPWASMQGAIERLAEVFETRLRYDKTKEAAFERLYSELDSLSRDEANQRLKPLYLDLILLYDRVEQICAAQVDPAIADLLGTIRDELLEVLYRRDVAPIGHASTTFDSSVQQAIGTEPAFSPDDNNIVARVVRRGFRHGERVLRPEEVILKRYRHEVKA